MQAMNRQALRSWRLLPKATFFLADGYHNALRFLKFAMFIVGSSIASLVFLGLIIIGIAYIAAQAPISAPDRSGVDEYTPVQKHALKLHSLHVRHDVCSTGGCAGRINGDLDLPYEIALEERRLRQMKHALKKTLDIKTPPELNP